MARKRKAKDRDDQARDTNSSVGDGAADRAPVRKRPLSKLQEKMRKELEAGQFRQLNEKMYKSTGAEALKMMKKDPNLFEIYHRGYGEQVKKWPSNPLDHIIAQIRKMPADYTVADFGCGEARLAAEVPQKAVHSFDLVASNDRVTACDMRNTRLGAESVDVCVFCLSLMGTDYPSFLQEARRVLRRSGRLIIAEVTTRIPEAESFVACVQLLGFRLEREKHLSDFFTIWFFKSTASSSKGADKALDSFPPLKASLYKKR